MTETRTTEPMPIESIEASNTVTADAAVSPVPPTIWARYQKFLRDKAEQPERTDSPESQLQQFHRDIEQLKVELPRVIERMQQRLEAEQRQDELQEMFERIEIDLGLRRDPAWKPEPEGPDALELMVWGEDAYLTPEQRHIKSLVGFLPQEPERKPYRELSALEMDEQAKLKPWRPKGSN